MYTETEREQERERERQNCVHVTNADIIAIMVTLLMYDHYWKKQPATKSVNDVLENGIAPKQMLAQFRQADL